MHFGRNVVFYIPRSHLRYVFVKVKPRPCKSLLINAFAPADARLSLTYLRTFTSSLSFPRANKPGELCDRAQVWVSTVCVFVCAGAQVSADRCSHFIIVTHRRTFSILVLFSLPALNKQPASRTVSCFHIEKNNKTQHKPLHPGSPAALCCCSAPEISP